MGPLAGDSGVLAFFREMACTFTPACLGSALYAVEGQLLP